MSRQNRINELMNDYGMTDTAAEEFIKGEEEFDQDFLEVVNREVESIRERIRREEKARMAENIGRISG